MDHRQAVASGSDIIEKAAMALDRDLCDHCLGRLFAKAGFRLSNEERGKALRICLALSVESREGGAAVKDLPFLDRVPIHERKRAPADVPSPDKDEGGGWSVPVTPSLGTPWRDASGDEGECWLCGGIFDDLDDLASMVEASTRDLEFSTFLIGCRIDPAITEKEQKLWEAVDPPCPEPLKEELNREIGKLVSKMLPDREFDKDDPEVAFVVDPFFKKVDAQVKPLFVYGRYNKLKRGIPQTRWPCRTCKGKGCAACQGTGKTYMTSVEEMIGVHFTADAKAEDFKLHGMGREDIDVLTLGTGRPFILEISRPRTRSIDLEGLGAKVNSASEGVVHVRDLRFAKRSEVQQIKDGTTLKRYRAVISSTSHLEEEKVKYAISLLAQSPIKQRTPERVAHRRADLVRTRSVHEAEVSMLGDGRAMVDLLTDGGLYIKELLNGDKGRTQPSLSSLLGCDITVESLDVIDVRSDHDGTATCPGVEADGEKVQGNDVKHPPDVQEEPSR